MNNKQKAQEILNCKNCHIKLKAGGVKCPPECTSFKDLMQMAKWKEQEIIDKASKWFEDNFKDFFEEEMMSNIITEFKKAVKEE